MKPIFVPIWGTLGKFQNRVAGFNSMAQCSRQRIALLRFNSLADIVHGKNTV